MKIVLVNYRYFFSGGPERYMFNIKQILEDNGHLVIPYSIQHKLNVKSEYEKEFLSPIGKGEEVYFSDVQKNKSLSARWKGFTRMVYSTEARKSFKKFLKKHNPDIVYILYYQNKMSCSIVDAAYEMGIPVVHRISDYSLVVPCSMMYNQNKRCLCEECLYGSIFNAISECCIYGSAIYSWVKVLALQVQKWRRISKKTAAYVFPSAFTMSKFVDAGFNKDKLYFVPTLFNKATLIKGLNVEWNDFALYIGRVDPDKGIKTLLDGFVDTPYNLKIIGYTSKDYLTELREYLKEKNHRIEFLGKMDFYQMQEYLSKCLFTIIPSEWYDNLPNTLIEAFAMKKCVVASNIGSLAENIEDEQTGMLFDCKNACDLRSKVDYLFTHKEKAKEWGENAALFADEKFSVETHYSALMKVFEKVIHSNN
jgi:glycosyltransferase involved in cell wall biosynthesis